MRNFKQTITISFFFCISGITFSQVPHFEKYAITQTGAFIYMPEEPVFDLTYSEDSSAVYTSETTFDSIRYGIIYVALKTDLGDVTADWENMLWSYMQYLNGAAFDLSSATDPGYGHTLPSDSTAHGILEYGVDNSGNQMSVKGWVNKNALAILYMYSKNEMNINFQSIYLNGIRFPVQ